MITRTRSGLSTKHSPQTTPPGGSRYGGRKPGSGEEGRARTEPEKGCSLGSAPSPHFLTLVSRSQLHFIRHYLAEVKKGETVSEEEQKKLEEDLLVEANW